MLYLRVAETTASEMIGTGSGVAGKEIAPCGNVGDPEQCNGPMFLPGTLPGLLKSVGPVELEEFQLVSRRDGRERSLMYLASLGILCRKIRSQATEQKECNNTHGAPVLDNMSKA